MSPAAWLGAPRVRLPLANRQQAGRLLAEALSHLRGRTDLVVLALPRGGVPVAVEVARALHATLDVLIVRKLGVPGQEELAMGALASGGVRVLNDDVVRHLGLDRETIEAVTARELPELERRERAYRGSRLRPELKGRWAVLVDDGLATGSTMEAAIRAVHQLDAARLLVAVPVAPSETVHRLRRLVDELVCLAEPGPFFSIGQWYRDFGQVDDATVQALLAAFAQPPGAPLPADAAAH